jgi:hypothetical protein
MLFEISLKSKSKKKVFLTAIFREVSIMGMALSKWKMETFSWAIFKMERGMELVYVNLNQELYTKVTGEMISLMDQEPYFREIMKF